jgi:hypothetical protein
MIRLRTLSFAFATTLLMALPAAAQSDVVGRWEGTLATPQGALTVVFEIEAGEDGALGTTMYSPDQTPQPIPTGETTFMDGELVVTVPAVQGRYEGSLDEEGAFVGTWSQGPASLELTLSRVEGGGA